MRPKELLRKWVELFNRQDHEGMAALYADNAVNHQTPIGIVEGRENIHNMLKSDFGQFEMVCIIENIFEDGDVGILEWKDPKGLRGCGFFWTKDGKIIYQRGYWDRLSFMQQQGREAQ